MKDLLLVVMYIRKDKDGLWLMVLYRITVSWWYIVFSFCIIGFIGEREFICYLIWVVE